MFLSELICSIEVGILQNIQIDLVRVIWFEGDPISEELFGEALGL